MRRGDGVKVGYHGRSHGRAETKQEARRKTCHEKSAEAIVPNGNLLGKIRTLRCEQ